MGYSAKVSRVSAELLERMKCHLFEFTRLLAEDEARRHANFEEGSKDPLPYHDLRIEVLGLSEDDSKVVERFDTYFFPTEAKTHQHTPTRDKKPWYRGRARW